MAYHANLGQVGTLSSLPLAGEGRGQPRAPSFVLPGLPSTLPARGREPETALLTSHRFGSR